MTIVMILMMKMRRTMMTMTNKLTAEKIKAIILGHAVGDALGVPVEFASREELDSAPVEDMEGFGTYPLPAGCWSDDTTMTLCALESISHGTLDYDDIMRNFGRWYYKDEFTPTGEMFDVGNTCSFAIDNYFAKHIPADKCGLSSPQANGNGSLMRIIPFSLLGYVLPNMRKTLSENGSALTHAHMRSKIACVIYSEILAKLIEKPSKESVISGIEEALSLYSDEPEAKFYENLAKVGERDRDTIKSTGYVVDTLEAALWCLFNTDSYKDCVLAAVNLGDDTDTVAAIAGGLAGALYGLDNIPKKWLNTLKKRVYIESLCNAFAESLGKF